VRSEEKAHGALPGSCAAGGEAHFLGEDYGDTARDLSRSRSSVSAAVVEDVALAESGCREPLCGPSAVSSRCVAATTLAAPPATVRWSAVALSVTDTRVDSRGATNSTHASTAIDLRFLDPIGVAGPLTVDRDNQSSTQLQEKPEQGRDHIGTRWWEFVEK
jgi:hypothetical protein